MTSTTTVTRDASQHRYLALMEEMGLADEPSDEQWDEQSEFTSEWDADFLDPAEDSEVILQGAMSELRRPLLITVVVVGTVAILAVGLRAIIRTVRDHSA